MHTIEKVIVVAVLLLIVVSFYVIWQGVYIV